MNRFEYMNRIHDHIKYFINCRLVYISVDSDMEDESAIEFDKTIYFLDEVFNYAYCKSLNHYMDYLNVIISGLPSIETGTKLEYIGRDACFSKLREFLNDLMTAEKIPGLFEKKLLATESDPEWRKYFGLKEN